MSRLCLSRASYTCRVIVDVGRFSGFFRLSLFFLVIGARRIFGLPFSLYGSSLNINQNNLASISKVVEASLFVGRNLDSLSVSHSEYI